MITTLLCIGMGGALVGYLIGRAAGVDQGFEEGWDAALGDTRRRAALPFMKLTPKSEKKEDGI
jgi:hypothetical protein